MPLAQMLRFVVQHVAALAVRAEVRRPIVARVVVKVGSGKDDPRGLHAGIAGEGREVAQGAALAGTPAAGGVIPPSAIA